MRLKRFMHPAILLTTVLLFAACGDDDDNGTGPGNGQIGSMSATVTGDVSESLSGMAFYGGDATTGWGLYMGDAGDEESLIFFGGEGVRPATGTYTIETESETGGFYSHGPSGNVYVAESGELTITTSTSSRIAGSFEFTGTDFEGQSVTVEGTFNAPNTDDLQ